MIRLGFELISLAGDTVQKQAVDALLTCNDVTQRFGLTLTPSQAAQLVEARQTALGANGRIEFGGGVIEKLLGAFCDSPHLSPHNYAQTLDELIELFYYYKNETLELMSDDELIHFMKQAFDGVCQGSLELLADRELQRMATNLRFGRPCDAEEETAHDQA